MGAEPGGGAPETRSLPAELNRVLLSAKQRHNLTQGELATEAATRMAARHKTRHEEGQRPGVPRKGTPPASRVSAPLSAKTFENRISKALAGKRAGTWEQFSLLVEVLEEFAPDAPQPTTRQWEQMWKAEPWPAPRSDQPPSSLSPEEPGETDVTVAQRRPLTHLRGWPPPARLVGLVVAVVAGGAVVALALRPSGVLGTAQSDWPAGSGPFVDADCGPWQAGGNAGTLQYRGCARRVVGTVSAGVQVRASRDQDAVAPHLEVWTCKGGPVACDRPLDDPARVDHEFDSNPHPRGPVGGDGRLRTYATTVQTTAGPHRCFGARVRIGAGRYSGSPMVVAPNVACPAPDEWPDAPDQVGPAADAAAGSAPASSTGVVFTDAECASSWRTSALKDMEYRACLHLTPGAAPTWTVGAQLRNNGAVPRQVSMFVRLVPVPRAGGAPIDENEGTAEPVTVAPGTVASVALAQDKVTTVPTADRCAQAEVRPEVTPTPSWSDSPFYDSAGRRCTTAPPEGATPTNGDARSLHRRRQHRVRTRRKLRRRDGPDGPLDIGHRRSRQMKPPRKLGNK